MFVCQPDPDLTERPLRETNTKELQPFDYTTLDPQARVMVQQCADELKGLIKPQAKDIIEASQKLIVVKNQLGHGALGPGCRQNLSEQAGQRKTT